jgi:hypothetical protein
MAGMNTIEKRNDSSSVMITVVGIGRMNSPRMPPTNSIGENTTTVVNVPANDGEPTRSMAARITPIDSSLASRLASIDSEITMASSTIRPSVRIRPNRVIVFSEYPTPQSPASEPIVTRPMKPAVSTATRHPIRIRLTTATAASPVSRFVVNDDSCDRTPLAKSAVTYASNPSSSGSSALVSSPSSRSLKPSTSRPSPSARTRPTATASW